MACTEKSTPTVTMLRQAESWVDETYTDYRNRGLCASVAQEQTAMELGITARRVRSLLMGFAETICHDRWQDMRQRFLTHLENEADFAMKRAAQRTARRKEMEQERAALKETRV